MKPVLYVGNRNYSPEMLAEPAFRAWEAEAIAETWTMPEWDDV